MKRSAFSLLEVMIATAVLAASAMVLSSLIGLGSKYGNRAEERTVALSQAESLLDEFLAGLGRGDNRLEEITGELPGPPPRGFRISATPFEIGNVNASQVATGSQGAKNTGAGAETRKGGLLRVTVEVFESTAANVSGEAQPLVELSRLIRQPQAASEALSNGMQTDGARGASSLQDAFP